MAMKKQITANQRDAPKPTVSTVSEWKDFPRYDTFINGIELIKFGLNRLE